MNGFRYFIIFLLLLSNKGFPSDINLNQENENKIYHSNIKTVLLSKEGFEMGAPVIRLNSTEKLSLTFDDLDSDLKYYKFTFVHCQYDWKTSPDLRPSDYIQGFQEDQIVEYAYSFNTTVPYTHYSLKFPTQNIQPRLSGNYILKVYLDNPENPAFTWRFMIFESLNEMVSGQVHQANQINSRLSKQQLDFTIDLKGLILDNPEQNIKAVITQNDRSDNALKNLKPTFCRAGSLDFTNNDEIAFDAGNEFRACDIKSLVYQSERIRSIHSDKDGYQVILLDDTRRTFKNYSSEKDINGRKLIHSDDHATNSEIESDYAWVYFSLPYPALLTNGKIYLLGSLTDWQLNENSVMSYDFERKCYSKKLLLKQGYYNYLYLFVDQVKNEGDISFIEGSHWETENEYTIWVYYRDIRGLYDRLLSVMNLNMQK